MIGGKKINKKMCVSELRDGFFLTQRTFRKEGRARTVDMIRITEAVMNAKRNLETEYIPSELRVMFFFAFWTETMGEF
jgi:hypothetical protein